ncbi:MAG: metallophosphoesterase family protein [Anaerolineales bacterium]|nr:metallophosphoesterase family protein [Anaerolineales bacterium]
MRIAALYDIHGNLAALEAIHQELAADPVDLVIVGGDVVAGPFPRECLALLQNLSIPCRYLHGNAESDWRALYEGRPVQGLMPNAASMAAWVDSQLTAEQKAFVADWPLTVTVPWADSQLLFCHAIPANDTWIFTSETPANEVESHLAGSYAAAIICGHTHMQFDRQIGTQRVINAGSVGAPFGRTGADWLLIDDDQFILKHTTYDLAAAAATVRQSDFPGAEQFAAVNILQPPTREQALAFLAELAAGQAG